jgi:hypothetical protein
MGLFLRIVFECCSSIVLVVRHPVLLVFRIVVRRADRRFCPWLFVRVICTITATEPYVGSVPRLGQYEGGTRLLIHGQSISLTEYRYVHKITAYLKITQSDFEYR